MHDYIIFTVLSQGSYYFYSLGSLGPGLGWFYHRFPQRENTDHLYIAARTETIIRRGIGLTTGFIGLQVSYTQPSLLQLQLSHNSC
jgi:hypothetical protein